MKTYGLIVADNGSDMYVTGTFDPRWPALFDAGFHPQFRTLRATDFEIVKLGWHPVFVSDAAVTEGDAGPTTAVFAVTLLAPADRTVTVNYATANGTATAGSDYVATSGTLTFPPGTVTRTISVTVNGDSAFDGHRPLGLQRRHRNPHLRLRRRGADRPRIRRRRRGR
jgi:hypothetical protein